MKKYVMSAVIGFALLNGASVHAGSKSAPVDTLVPNRVLSTGKGFNMSHAVKSVSAVGKTYDRYFACVAECQGPNQYCQELPDGWTFMCVQK